VAEWTVVIPVKGTASAKSRLGASPELALAIALDTVEAALGAGPSTSSGTSVSPVPELVEGRTVIVVTSATIATQFEALGARVLIDEGHGLNAAIAQGVAVAEGPVAVLLGDVPALRHEELAAALCLAAQHPTAFVADADNDGTVLLTALDRADHRPAFGAHSRSAHLAAGYVELDIPEESGLRRDVDTSEQLAALAARVGPRTKLAAEIALNWG
jgi:2-phospho-L-lactate guanylyltransferase